MGKRRRWKREEYPGNWEEMSWAFRKSKQFTCEHCGTVQGTWRISKAWNLYRSKTMAAHRYPNDTRNPDPELLCLCERCHFPYDGQFRAILEEGEHQAVLHGILVERYQGDGPEEEEEGCALLELDGPVVGVEQVCCSCGGCDDSIAYGCGFCGRPVHYQEPECGAWLLDSWHDAAGEDNEFWCHDCWANGLP